ncbi:hypothetical protein PspLS_07995 [Pyricularia sp. CBS 133598]|nr:hypothetical protein PspLS_07995 [Pyricularia sp. CBS 133598]
MRENRCSNWPASKILCHGYSSAQSCSRPTGPMALHAIKNWTWQCRDSPPRSHQRHWLKHHHLDRQLPSLRPLACTMRDGRL